MKSKNGTVWDYYELGEIVRPANVKILEQTCGNQTTTGSFYRVQQLCCGEEAVLSHRVISRRGSGRCRKCSMLWRSKVARRRMAARSSRKCKVLVDSDVAIVRHISAKDVRLAPGYHGWERPEYVDGGYWLWCDW